MRVVVIYRDTSEHATTVESYMRDFERQVGRRLETLNPDSPEGADFCRIYDVVEYPSMIALDDEGKLQNFWSGLPLPTIAEVSYYA